MPAASDKNVLKVVSTYDPHRIPAQMRFHTSTARIRGY